MIVNFKGSKEELTAKIKKIKLLLMDCDGVLTDARIYYSDRGDEFKSFNVRDGYGIKLWHARGFESGVITGRKSAALAYRVKELGIKYFHEQVKEKSKSLEEISIAGKYSLDEIAYIGDDVPDLSVMRKCGVSIAVQDAAAELISACDLITTRVGGNAAVREAVEYLLSENSF